MNINTDLYTILELDKNANISEIKQNFKKLALKYHPDKYKNKDANEKFNHIRVAYEILSNPDKKNKYDKMLEPKKKHFINKILLFLREITDPFTLNSLINRIDLSNDIKKGDINIIANKIIQKLLDELDDESDIIQLSEIFIHSKENDILKNSTSIQSSVILSYNTSNYNTLNIIGNIKINLEDIYNDNFKEIIIKRKVIDNNKLNYETNKYIIPLYKNSIIIYNAGDKIINNDNIEIGDVILRINHKKDKNNKIIRMRSEIINNDLNSNHKKYIYSYLYGVELCDDNINISPKIKYNLIYKDNISLYTLFNTLDININIFGNIFNIKSIKPLNDFIFDGEKLIIILKNKGLPYNDNARGDLLVFLFLIKDNNFNKILELAI